MFKSIESRLKKDIISNISHLCTINRCVTWLCVKKKTHPKYQLLHTSLSKQKDKIDKKLSFFHQKWASFFLSLMKLIVWISSNGSNQKTKERLFYFVYCLQAQKHSNLTSGHKEKHSVVKLCLICLNKYQIRLQKFLKFVQKIFTYDHDGVWKLCEFGQFEKNNTWFNEFL